MADKKTEDLTKTTQFTCERTKTILQIQTLFNCVSNGVTDLEIMIFMYQ